MQVIGLDDWMTMPHQYQVNAIECALSMEYATSVPLDIPCHCSKYDTLKSMSTFMIDEVPHQKIDENNPMKYTTQYYNTICLVQH